MIQDSNPVLVNGLSVSAVLILVKAFITLGESSGWWTSDQAKNWATFLDVALPILAVWGAAWILRNKVTPSAKPRDEDGTPLTRPDNTPAISEIRAAQNEAIKIDKEVMRDKEAM